MPIKAGYLLLSAGGGVLVWSGLKGKSVSSVFRQLAGGDAPQNAASANAIAGVSSSASSALSSITGIATGGAAGGTAAKNQAIAKTLAAAYGWSTGTEWNDLLQLWNKESGWSNTANNPTSGAYGIAQALPSTKYPLAGRPPSEGGSSNATVQISWGLSYIKARYGSPSAAWAHETAYNWY